MARILIATLPFTGHFTPGLPIARELIARGHEVAWYTGQKFRAKVEATGATYIPMQKGRDFDDGDLDAEFPGRDQFEGINKLKYDLKHVFTDSVPGHIEDLRHIQLKFHPDVIVGDTGFTASAVYHEMGGPVWASFGITALTFGSRDTAPFGLGMMPSSSVMGRLRNRALYMLLDKVLFRDVNAHYLDVCRRFSLPVIERPLMDVPLSPYLYLQATHPDFEFPRTDMPPQVHFIGPFLPDAPKDFTLPAWWAEMVESKRPVVHVTQGTLATESDELIAPALQALADEDVMVVAVTGGKPVETVNLPSLSGNARLERFIPYYHLLPHVDVMLTNGGYGGVQIALSHGVPLIVAGTTEDKAEIANRIEWSGVGMNLKTNRPTHEQIRESVRRVVSDASYRQKAQAMQAKFASTNAPAQAAALIEQLAATQQPVVSRQAVRAEGKRTTSNVAAVGEA